MQTHWVVDCIEEEDEEKGDDLWTKMMEEARSDIEEEPILSKYYFNSILAHNLIESALANHLSDDLRATKERNPACISYVHCLLNFKGFLAYIHPGAKIGHGILLDHATGVIVEETTVIKNNISTLHNVTLGGNWKIFGDRHTKIGDGGLIVAWTCILGNIKIGEGAKIGAGSVVLKEVPPRTTAAGNPTRLVGRRQNPIKLDNNLGLTMDHTSHISEWLDYVIYIHIMLLFGFFYLDLFLGLLLCRYDENWSFVVCVLSENLGSPI
ncbi:hypothetical protein UlMin_019460 [Ulmus minor]